MRMASIHMGGRILLVVALAPALGAGTRLSRAAGLTAVALGRAAQAAEGAPEPETALGLAARGPVAAQAPPPGYAFPAVWFPCTSPEEQPRADADPAFIAHLVEAGLRGYEAAGFDLYPEEPPHCPEPAPDYPKGKVAWTPKLGARIDLLGSYPAARTVGGNRGEADSYLEALNHRVVYALAEFREATGGDRDRTPMGPERVLLNRLLEAGTFAARLQATQDMGQLLDKRLRFQEAKARPAQAGQARYERAQLAISLRLVGDALGRFREYALPLLTEMGVVESWESLLEKTRAQEDAAKAGSRASGKRHRGV